jgi:hypothetical protein
MNGRTVKMGNMKYSGRKIRQNKSGKKRINMHENNTEHEEASICNILKHCIGRIF